MKGRLESRYTPLYRDETSYPFIPAIREQYDNNTSTTSSSLASLVNLITEMEMHRETWTKENPFLEICDNVNEVSNELPRERSLTSTDSEENVIRNSCRFQQTRRGKCFDLKLEFPYELFHYHFTSKS